MTSSLVIGPIQYCMPSVPPLAAATWQAGQPSQRTGMLAPTSWPPHVPPRAKAPACRPLGKPSSLTRDLKVEKVRALPNQLAQVGREGAGDRRVCKDVLQDKRAHAAEGDKLATAEEHVVERPGFRGGGAGGGEWVHRGTGAGRPDKQQRDWFRRRRRPAGARWKQQLPGGPGHGC
jgi:hypothetical protein